MPIIFQWAGRNTRGEVLKGEFTANTRDEVLAHLRKERITPTVVREKPKSGFNFPFGGGVKDKDLVIFSKQFSTMIDAGLPLVQALDILSQQTENKNLAKAAGEIKIDVEGGSTYADALKKHPKIFSELYTNMVAAGESGGTLDIILARLADYIEKAMKLKKKVVGAMIYPTVIIAVAVIVIGVILVFVIPTFAKMFSAYGGILPLPTRIIIAMSGFLSGIGGIIVLGAIVGFIVFIIQTRKTYKGRRITDSIALKTPVVGILVRKVAIAKFTRTLGTLISSGVPILDGLAITAKTAGNLIIEEAVLEVRKGVSEGKTIAEPLSASKVFPPMVTQMIAVGETTGAVDNMLNKIADFYDDEVDNATNNLTAMMEPLLMIFLGVTIGFIVIAMYMPIFKLITLIK
ncbi:MAG: type II secretion system F family protein [Nitrospirae bacterium]|nr:type II secretion system F family protein [Nitrospirota bacterium]